MSYTCRTLRQLVLVKNIHRICSQRYNIRCFHRTVINLRKTDNSVDYDEPIKFSTSEAARTSLRDRFSAPNSRDAPVYEPFCIAFSIFAILIYFCILREENDLDEAMSKPLYSRIQGLEENHLRIALRHSTQGGAEREAMEKRLKQLIEEKKARENNGES